MLARLGSLLGRWPIALAASALLAAAILLPGLGDAGLWEPQERAFADAKAPREEIQAQRDKQEAEAEAAKAAAKAKAEAAASGSGSGERPPASGSGERPAASGSGERPAASGSGERPPASGSGERPAASGSGERPAAPAPAPAPPPPTTSTPSAPGTAGVGTTTSPTSKPRPLTGPVASAAALAADTEACPRVPPKDATARSLTARAAAWGRDTFGDNDAGRRLPLALLGLLTALAIAGTTMRLAGPRAGLLACAIGVSFPLLVLQSRMLTSEIGTACGTSLVIYGAVAIGHARATALGIVEALVGAIAGLAGLYLGFAGGGALLGVVVPLGALALAGGVGVPALRGRPEESIASGAIALGAGIAALAVLAILAHQVYVLEVPKLGAIPPQRELLGKAIVSSPCWSSALGATWRADDDTRYIFDSTWEQIAYGTYPWGLLAPIAIGALISSGNPRRRKLGALTLAWAGCAWVASEVFQRKAGATIFAGFPALAIAVGAWLDSFFGPRTPGDADAEPRVPRGAVLIGLFAILATLDIGKDMNEFADKVTSLLVGGEGIAYPAQAHLALLPAKLWILILGMLVALPIGVALRGWRGSDVGRRVEVTLVAIGIAFTVVFAAFWAFAWQPRLSENLSTKTMFDMYAELHKPGEPLVMMGDLGEAPADYARDVTPEIMASREQVVKALGRPGRVFAIAPAGERCALHREIGGKPYFVLDDRNTRDLLLSNEVTGATDKNPLAVAIVHSAPTDIPTKPKARIVFDNRIELLGWSLPKTVGRGDHFEVVMYYRVLQSVGGAWKIFFHFDGPQALRFGGDHPPIDELCPTSTWQAGDYIIDRHVVQAGAGAFPKGSYDVWTGFFTGTNPNFKNMPISEGPGDMRDPAGTDRIKITTITLE